MQCIKQCFKNMYHRYIKNTAAKIIGLLKKTMIPTVFVAVFYVLSFVLGNRSTCLFKATYGVPCPGCGMTRSFSAFFHGDIQQAFFYHPLFFIPMIAGMIFLLRKTKMISPVYHSRLFWMGIFLLLMLVWVIRMAGMFPERAPMDFNEQGLFPNLYSMIFSK